MKNEKNKKFSKKSANTDKISDTDNSIKNKVKSTQDKSINLAAPTESKKEKKTTVKQSDNTILQKPITDEAINTPEQIETTKNAAEGEAVKKKEAENQTQIKEPKQTETQKQNEAKPITQAQLLEQSQGLLSQQRQSVQSPEQSQEQSQQQPKSKRGRPKGSKKTATEGESDFLKDLKDYKETPQEQAQQQQQAAMNNENILITGYILLCLCDVVFPAILPFIFAKFLKVKIKPEQLELSEKEFTQLEPISDKAAEYISIKINPLLLFAVSLGAIYTKKAMHIKATDIQPKVKNKK